MVHGITGRNYDPATGRWTGQDRSFFLAQDANLYRYAGNAPVARKDPSGQCEWWQTALACRIIEGAESLAQSSVNYVAEKVQQAFETVVVAGQNVRAQVRETLNAAGQTVRVLVADGIGTVIEAGHRVIAASEDAARGFADHITKFQRQIEDLWALADKFGQNAKAVLEAIVANPGEFAQNLLAGVGTGFQNFKAKIGDYLPASLFTWFTQAIKSTTILPEKFDIPAIGTFLLNYLGLNWDNITSILVEKIGPQNIALIDQAYTFISGLVEKGPEGVYKLLQEKLVNYDPTTLVNDAIKAGGAYVAKYVITPLVAKVVGLFSPIPATLLLSIYDGLDWFFNNAKDLLGVFNTVVDGIGAVAAGKPNVLAVKVEAALKASLVPAIKFGAAQVPGLSKLPEKIGELISLPKDKITEQIGKFVDVLLGKALAALGLKKDEAIGLISTPIEWYAAGDDHQLRLVTNGKTTTVLLASSPIEEYTVKLKALQQAATQQKVDIKRLSESITTAIGTLINLGDQKKLLSPKSPSSGLDKSIKAQELVIEGLLRQAQELVASPEKKQGDHVFNKGLGRGLERLYKILAEKQFWPELTDILKAAQETLKQAPFALTVNRGRVPVDVNSEQFGNAIFEFRSLISSFILLATTEGSAAARTSYSQRLLLAWRQLVAASVDEEAAKQVSQPKQRQQLQSGRLTIKKIGDDVAAVLGHP